MPTIEVLRVFEEVLSNQFDAGQIMVRQKIWWIHSVEMVAVDYDSWSPQINCDRKGCHQFFHGCSHDMSNFRSFVRHEVRQLGWRKTMRLPPRLSELNCPNVMTERGFGSIPLSLLWLCWWCKIKWFVMVCNKIPILVSCDQISCSLNHPVLGSVFDQKPFIRSWFKFIEHDEWGWKYNKMNSSVDILEKRSEKLNDA